MIHVRGARAGALGILPSRAEMCILIAIGERLKTIPPRSWYHVASLIKKSNPRRTAGCTVRKQPSINRFMIAIIMKDLDVVVVVVFCILLLLFFIKIFLWWWWWDGISSNAGSLFSSFLISFFCALTTVSCIILDTYRRSIRDREIKLHFLKIIIDWNSFWMPRKFQWEFYFGRAISA